MSNIKRLREVLEPVAMSHNVFINDLVWRNEGSMKFLEIPIMFKDGTMDLETSSLMSGLFLDALETVEGMEFEYFLDVCSPGAERLLNSDDEIEAVVGEYVYVKLQNPKAGVFEIYGDLEKNEPELITIAYMDKTRKKTFDIDKDNIKLIRLAIKF